MSASVHMEMGGLGRSGLGDGSVPEYEMAVFAMPEEQFFSVGGDGGNMQGEVGTLLGLPDDEQMMHQRNVNEELELTPPPPTVAPQMQHTEQ